MPTVGVGVTAVLASLLTVYNYTAGSARVFEILVLVTTFTATVPYLLATAAQLFHLARGEHEKVNRARLVRDAVLAALAFGFSLWLVAGAGYAAVYQGVLFLRGRAGLRLAGGPAGAQPPEHGADGGDFPVPCAGV
ncbi:hypothetical protein SGLAM104S_05722 [Streptomyces glaucescens]